MWISLYYVLLLHLFVSVSTEDLIPALLLNNKNIIRLSAGHCLVSSEMWFDNSVQLLGRRLQVLVTQQWRRGNQNVLSHGIEGNLRTENRTL